jgi:hypothetical protein
MRELPDVGVRRAVLPGMRVHGELYGYPVDVLGIDQLRPVVMHSRGLYVERVGVHRHRLAVLDLHNLSNVHHQPLLQLDDRSVHRNRSPVRLVHEPDGLRHAIRMQLVDR